MNSDKTIFITGGAGFIGLAAAKHFAAKGFRVKLFDVADAPQNLSREIEYISGSIMYSDEVYQAMAGCDYLIHLAAMLGVQNTEENRLGCLDVNIQGTKNVYDAAVKAGVKKIIFSSSSEVYGEPVKIPLSEDTPVFPKSVYAVTKLAGEEYLKAYHQRFGIDYSIIRFFNIYGAGQSMHFVMSKFVRAVVDDLQPTVHGKGDQVRCFCHVSDAVRGVERVLTDEKANSEIFNIGNDTEPITMKDLAYKVIEVSGKKIEPVFLDMKNSDRTNEREIIKRIPDITKACRVLQYEPKMTLHDGICDVLMDHTPRV